MVTDGLDAGFLSMMQAPVVLERATGTDTWGNETYGAGSTEQAFIDAATKSLGAVARDSQAEHQPDDSENDLYMDWLDIKPKDRIVYDGIPHYVTQVNNLKGEFGENLMQTVTVSTTKRG